MKKNRVLLMLSVLSMCLSGCFSSFSGTGNDDYNNNAGIDGSATVEEHEHSYSYEWDWDDEYHWRSATCGHDLIKDKEEHLKKWITLSEPTEFYEGLKYFYCDICFYTSKYYTIPKTDHVHYPGEIEEKVIVSPTCLEDGLKFQTVYCGGCGEVLDTQEIVINALGHNTIHIAAKDPTCVREGYNDYYQCIRCDYNTRVAIAPTGHTPGEMTLEYVKKEPTCKEEGLGYLSSRCTVCGDVVDDSWVNIPALGHDLVHHAETDSTCTERGHYEYDSCARCDYSTIVEKALLPHNIYINVSMTKYPTDKYTAGVYQLYFNCDVCNQRVKYVGKQSTGNTSWIKLGDENVNSIIEGDEVQFDVTTNANGKKVKFKVLNEDVISIDENGKMTALQPGSSMIFAYTDNLEVSSAYYVVKENEFSISLPLTSYYIGDTFAIGYDKFTRQTTDTVEWSSSDESIATVNENGEVELCGIGEVTLSGKTSSGLVDSKTITVRKHFANVRQKEITVAREERTDLFNSYSRDFIFNWTSTDETIAKAEGGRLITYSKYGTVTIRSTSEYLDEDIVIVVHVASTTVSLNSSNYRSYMSVTFTVSQVSASLGYNWNVEAEVTLSHLWEITSRITFTLSFPYKNSLTSGTMTVNVKIEPGQTKSASTYVMPCSYNTGLYGNIKPSYSITSVSGSITK